MSDPISQSTLAFDALRVLAYLNAGVAAAFATALIVALVCSVFELHSEGGRQHRSHRSWRLLVAAFVVWPVGLYAQAQRQARTTQQSLPAISLEQDTARTVTRRISPEAGLWGLSPDGRLAVFTDWRSTHELSIRNMETGAIRPLTASGGKGIADEGAVFSHDGKRIAYVWYDVAEPGYYKLGVVGVEGREPRIIYRDRTSTWIGVGDWSPDGRYIVIVRTAEGRDATELLLIRAEDGDAQLLRSFPNPSPGKGPGGMCFSADGRYIFYHRWRDGSENNDVYVLPARENGEERVLIESPADDRVLGCAPDGRHLLFQSDRSGTPGAWLLPVANGKATGTPWLVKPDMWRAKPVGFTQDGRYFYKVSTSRSDVYVVNFDAESHSVVGSPTAISARSLGNTGGALWSPDGRYLAYRRERDQVSSLDRIVVQSTETGDVKEFNLRVPGWMGVHSWTADGRSLLVWVSNPGDRDNRYALYRVDVQTGRKEIVPNPLPNFGYFLPTRDSRFFVYEPSEENAASEAAFRVVRYDRATGDTTVLFRTPFGAWGQILGATLSPDGGTLAFGYAPVVGSFGKSLVLLTVATGEVRELPIEGVRSPTWMPDGRALLFRRWVKDSQAWDTWYVDLVDGEPHSIGLTTYATRPDLDVHPNGRRIAYTSGKEGTELWVMENFLPKESTK